MTARITHLIGRCRSGADSTGTVTHIVEGWRALCGKEPGPRSVGWSEYNDAELTCPKCKRIQRGKMPNCPQCDGELHNGYCQSCKAAFEIAL